MMNDLNQNHIVRFITAGQRLEINGEEHYMMFGWADGKILRNRWETIPSPTLTGDLISAGCLLGWYLSLFLIRKAFTYTDKLLHQEHEQSS